MPGLVLFALVLASVGSILPDRWWDSASPEFLFLIGFIGLWRYSWGLVHLSRSLIYRHFVFPRIRRRAESMGDDALPSHVYLMVTSFRIDAATTARVYRSVIAEAVASGLRCTIVASVVEMADQRLIKRLFEKLAATTEIRLIMVRIPGTGKRDALAQGFRAISHDRPAADAAVCVIDGDTILKPGILRSSLPLLKASPRAAAFTTDEICEVQGNRLFREWYNMRFAQRQILMSSMGLSRRVLTLTGRMSAFKARVICNPEFIGMVERDYIQHWRFGRLRFLTGDDKSTWFYLLKSGYEMLYVPDVQVITVEHPPHANFPIASTQLMIRWFGNMLRTNGRAIALGPRRIGLFTWWCVVDQRISMWTSLTGLTAALLVATAGHPWLLFGYFYWVALSRFVQTLLLLTVRHRVSWAYPFLLYYNQVYGSLVKTYIFFRPNLQSWTRQKTRFAQTEDVVERRWIGLGSGAAHAVGMLLLIALIGNLIHLFNFADAGGVSILFHGAL